MSEAEIQKVVEAWETLKEQLEPIAEAIRKIGKEIVRIFKEVFKEILIGIIKLINDKKACKCLHIWLHTKNKRIRKKQSKRLNNIILSYMPL